MTVRLISSIEQTPESDRTMIICGKPGSGKTYMGARIARLRAGPKIEELDSITNEVISVSRQGQRVLVIDPLDNYQFADYTIDAKTVTSDLARLNEISGGNGWLASIPVGRNVSDPETIANIVSGACRMMRSGSKRKGRFGTIIIEEFGALRGRGPRSLERLYESVRASRHEGVGIVISTQRFNDAPPVVRANSEGLIVFRTADPATVKELNSSWGVPMDEARRVTGLEPRYYLKVDGDGHRFFSPLGKLPE